jgi:hypothetical protein
MRSLIARRKHVALTQSIAAFYDPNMPTRDAVMLWRKALRRADKETKKLLLSMVRQVRERKTDGASRIRDAVSDSSRCAARAAPDLSALGQ